MKEIYLAILFLSSLFITDSRATIMETAGASDCGASIPTAGFQDGVPCNGYNEKIAANDLVIPIGSNLTLESVSANLSMLKSDSITAVKVWVFYDSYGYPYGIPGDEVTTQTIKPTSLNAIGENGDTAYYQLNVELSPIVLFGNKDYETRYWVGLSVYTADSSTVLWEVTDETMIGKPATYSTGSWFDMYDTSLDGTYTFEATCSPIEDDSDLDCGAAIASDGFHSYLACNAANNEIVANDILVPAEFDLRLDSIKAYLVLEGNATISTVDVMVFPDIYGYPEGGATNALYTQSVIPSSVTAMGNKDGMNYYAVVLPLDSMLLEGNPSFWGIRYWIGLSVTTSDGSTAYWEITDNQILGKQVATSNGGAFNHFASAYDGAYTFYATCSPAINEGGGSDDDTTHTEVCTITQLADSTTQHIGLECSYNGSYYAANDFVVPSGKDMILTAITPRIILDTGITSSGADIYIYEDENGLPGTEIFHTITGPKEHTFIATTPDGKDVYDITFALDSILLIGNKDTSSTYWISISTLTSNSSEAFWEITTENMKGSPTAIKKGGNFSHPNPAYDGVYSFSFLCRTITENTGPESGYCSFTDVSIDQSQDDVCFGYVTQGGMLQSFTAEKTQSSGVGIKFKDQTRGLEVILSLWDGIPSKDGNMLAVKTTETFGSQWVDVFWETPVNLVPGKTYYIMVDGGDDLSCLRASNGDTYPGGQAYANSQPFPDYDYNFRTFFCNNNLCSKMDRGYSGSYENSYVSSAGKLVATDITIPIAESFTLQEIQTTIWTFPAAHVDSADIIIYKDNQGKPGEIFDRISGVRPSSVLYVNNAYGYDIHLVTFDVSQVELHGNFNNITTYWIALDISANVGTANISVSSTGMQAYPTFISSDNGASWESTVDWETKYVFNGLCKPLAYNPCDNPVEIISINGNECMSTFSYKTGVAQSFTAEASVSAGAGIEFQAPAMNYDVSIELWDALPIQGGSKLASKPVEVHGQHWVNVFWDEVVSLTPGEQYFIVLNGDYGLPCLSGTAYDAYPGGNLYYGEAYESFPDYDYSFKTFACMRPQDTSNCYEEVQPIDNITEGVNVSASSAFLSANDLTVPAGEIYELTSMKVHLISDTTIFQVDVNYYADDHGKPGELIGSEEAAEIAGQVYQGEVSDFNLYELDIDLEPFTFEGLIDTTSTYWVSLSCTNINHSQSVYWAALTSTQNGYPVAQSENGGAWTYPDDSYEGIYRWNFNCSEITVGTDYADLSADFTLYPNPASGIVYIRSMDKIDLVTVYSITGEELLHNTVNDYQATLYLTELDPGVYFIKARIQGKNAVQKVVLY